MSGITNNMSLQIATVYFVFLDLSRLHRTFSRRLLPSVHLSSSGHYAISCRILVLQVSLIYNGVRCNRTITQMWFLSYNNLCNQFCYLLACLCLMMTTKYSTKLQKYYKYSLLISNQLLLRISHLIWSSFSHYFAHCRTYHDDRMHNSRKYTGLDQLTK